MNCLRAFGYRWESNTEDVTDAVHVNHNVTKCPLGYEPFYVARAGTPDYDERFIGFGWTRNTQVHYFYVKTEKISCLWGVKNTGKFNDNLKIFSTN
jgi:hypothetical protein